ncbi:MAG: thioesterase superfamily protein [Candidatus Scalindua rubra]|uniref:Thioesterase superfamily protein n=1 Tax=Candidatus Scalindua rubra TaxID=1872076 RepID=A0A1E3X612_9BACT|nr:MAG: thioesterase superfamily protein [Candidatus Scalindua rubra]
MLTNTIEIRVRYAETDQMKRVYYPKYLEYFELGRAHLLRDYGIPYSEMESRLEVVWYRTLIFNSV